MIGFNHPSDLLYSHSEQLKEFSESINFRRRRDGSVENRLSLRKPMKKSRSPFGLKYNYASVCLKPILIITESFRSIKHHFILMRHRLSPNEVELFASCGRKKTHIDSYLSPKAFIKDPENKTTTTLQSVGDSELLLICWIAIKFPISGKSGITIGATSSRN